MPSSIISYRHYRSLASVIFILTLTCFVASGQTSEAPSQIGEWRTHLPNKRPTDVAVCESFTAWRTPGSVILRFRENNEIRRLDKTNALSEADPKLVTCNPFIPDQLLVTYEDGGIEVLDGDRAISYNDAISQTDIFGRRGINSVRILEPNLAAVCADFGFLFFDPSEGVFREDVRFDEAIYDAALFGDDLYLASERGLLRLPNFRSQPTIRDTSRYETVDVGVLDGQPITQLGVFGGRVYAGSGNGLVSVLPAGGDVRAVLTPGGCFGVREIQATDQRILFTYRDACGGPDALITSSDGLEFSQVTLDCSELIYGAVPLPSGGVALASFSDSAGLCELTADGTCDCVQLSGPFSTDTYAIATKEGRVAVAGGSLTEQAGYAFNNAGAYFFEDGAWTNVNPNNTPALQLPETPDPDDVLLDIIAVAIGEDSTLYAGAFFEGLAALAPSGEVIVYDERNSSLGIHLGDTERVRVSGLDTDAAGNLWVSNHGADEALSVRTPEGEWFSFDVTSCGSDRLLDLTVDARTGIVYVIDYLGGVIAFDPGPDFADTSDDVCRRFDTSDNLPEVDVRSIMLDRDGILWIGTVNGIARLPCTGNPFDEDCTANRPTSEVDGILGFFFDGELVRSMTTDPGDRKWLGTDNGLFLLADNTDEQLAFYNEDNSPLLDNRITALAFDDATGRLWIGTEAGLMSLQTESTGSEPFIFDAVEVYPQPVRPEYDGPIAIRGLATNANVKITDAAGRLVFETDAIGGQAIWNGTDYTGSRPASGVYLVWASAVVGDPPNTIVAKIALLR